MWQFGVLEDWTLAAIESGQRTGRRRTGEGRALLPYDNKDKGRKKDRVCLRVSESDNLSKQQDVNKITASHRHMWRYRTLSLSV